MTKSTHNGTCQACGRQQAARATDRSSTPLHHVAKHGYTVEHSFFNGVCHGADSRPMEEERAITDTIIAQLNNRAAILEAKTIDDITTVTMVKREGSNAWDRRDVEVTLRSEAEFIAFVANTSARGFTWDDRRAKALRDMHFEARSMRAHVALLESLLVARHGQPLVARKSVDAGDRSRIVVRTWADARAKREELEAAGFKVRVARDRNSDQLVVTGTR